ncbi:uncharacterized protein TA16720 [Theileria annulata]|uniref:V-SNARE coiled-coil homology domain-containing protein n=1 Tax=Theileria annulata TaxID=5874 RepID=Q4UII2_THEAN|nr:uncharacterized protein TA16720 [Theileria annulata]CAI73107.1 hypothetical protein, conserved [Theileria annulata]|eukprot:XP_953785.1 hypothetical protein, conserved [Theileria annulata]
MATWFNSFVDNLSAKKPTSEQPKPSQNQPGCHIYAIVVMRHFASKEACRLSAEYDFSPLPMYISKISREVTDLVSRTCAQEAFPDQSKGVVMENNMGTFYVKATNCPPPNQLVFIAAVNNECTKYQALQFLHEAIQIYKPAGNVVRDNVGDALRHPELRSLMLKYKGKRDVLLDAQTKLDETKMIVMDTLDGLINRQGNLDELIAKSHDMTQSTAKLMRLLISTQIFIKINIIIYFNFIFDYKTILGMPEGGTVVVV